jgi:hypothetical protein
MFPYNRTLPCVNRIPCLVLIVIFDIMHCHSHRSTVMLHLEWKNSLMPVYCNKAKEDKMQNILDLENISIYVTVEVLGTLFGHIIFISTYYLNLKILCRTYHHSYESCLTFHILFYIYFIIFKINLFSITWRDFSWHPWCLYFSVERRTQLGLKEGLNSVSLHGG